MSERAKEFFNQQSDLTATKIKFYNDYIGSYIIKILMQYGVCFIADLFCGPGMNGSKKGSPLVLIDQAEKMLTAPHLLNKYKNPEVVIQFNDKEQKNIENLNEELKKLPISDGIKILKVMNRSFSEVIEEAKKVLKDIKIPKFFFLDPFGLSEIELKDIKSIMEFPATEILLFLPTFHAYRFSEGKSELPPGLIKFLSDFTSKGVHNYSDIHDFNSSITEKIKDALGLKYVRPILLDGGSSKNCLFYLTKHIKGMIDMNTLVWKESPDGREVDTRSLTSTGKEQELFEVSQLSKEMMDFKNWFKKMLIEHRSLSNVDIIERVTIERFLCKHAVNILKQLKNEGKIRVEHLTEKKSGFYVAGDHWNSELSIIHYSD